MSEPKLTPLELAAKRNDLETVRFLLEKGACPDPKRKHYAGLALADALMSENYEMVELLLEHGSGINITMREVGTMNAFAGVCRRGDLELVELFIRHGADVNGDLSEDSPLQAALEKNRFEVVKLLFERGLKFNDPLLFSKMICSAIEHCSDAIDFLIEKYSLNLNSRLDESFFRSVRYLKQEKIRRDSETKTYDQWW